MAKKKHKKRKARKPETVSLAVALRAAIKQSGKTMYAVARDAELPYAGVHTFITGKRDNIGLRSASRIADSLGLELRPVRKGR